MAILRKKDLRKISGKELDKRLKELQLELSKEKANINIGATVTSSGRLKEIKRTIARIKTIQKQGGTEKE